MTQPTYTILVADDNPAYLQWIEKFLTDQNFKVETTHRGNMALAQAQYATTDLVLLGTNLPDITATAVCRILKATPHTPPLPVIFVSSTPERIDKQKLYDAGASDYVEQPFYPVELLARIRLHLEAGQMRRQLEAQMAQMHGLTTRLQYELAVAHKIQRGLLPPPSPNWPGLELVCYTHAAREVGGDFYAYHNFDTRLKLNEKRFAVAVGDVSGKGMPAALLMAISLASFQNLMAKSFSLNKLVTDMVSEAYPLNQLLLETGSGDCFLHPHHRPKLRPGLRRNHQACRAPAAYQLENRQCRLHYAVGAGGKSCGGMGGSGRHAAWLWPGGRFWVSGAGSSAGPQRCGYFDERWGD